MEQLVLFNLLSSRLSLLSIRSLDLSPYYLVSCRLLINIYSLELKFCFAAGVVPEVNRYLKYRTIQLAVNEAL